MSTHTPGPWALSSMRSAIGRHVTLEAHRDRPYGAAADATQCRARYQWTVAIVGEHSCHFSRDEADANARLIAAAPELLAALKEIERHCPCGARPESPQSHPHVGGCLVGAAITKAEGRA